MLNSTHQVRKPRLPRAFREAPKLDQAFQPMEIEEKSVLLINPFYVKDPNSSFGKHALTPSLALSSIAGATPDDWNVEFWDVNSP